VRDASRHAPPRDSSAKPLPAARHLCHQRRRIVQRCDRTKAADCAADVMQQLLQRAAEGVQQLLGLQLWEGSGDAAEQRARLVRCRLSLVQGSVVGWGCLFQKCMGSCPAMSKIGLLAVLRCTRQRSHHSELSGTQPSFFEPRCLLAACPSRSSCLPAS
jgi:hypothetical protein